MAVTRAGETCRGFTLIELLIALTISAVVAALALTLLIPVLDAFRAQAEAQDVRQRMRASSDWLTAALLEAGAGPYAGRATGSLQRFFPSVLPRRIGRRRADPPASAFGDRISLVAVPTMAPQAALARSMSAPDVPFDVANAPGCAVGRNACGFTPGTQAIVFDDTGAWDTFTVTVVAGASIGHAPPVLSKAYRVEEGAQVAAGVVQVFYHDAVERQLRRYDGDGSDLPLADDLVELRFRYLGDPAPPTSPRPPPGRANCLFSVDGTPDRPALGPSPGPLVELPLSMLADGPFCGEPPNVWDADLLRVRAVGVQLRYEASDPAVRASGNGWFIRPGHATRGAQLVPDYRLELQVAPRNLNAGR